jgi:hypothetical protein
MRGEYAVIDILCKVCIEHPNNFLLTKTIAANERIPPQVIHTSTNREVILAPARPLKRTYAMLGKVK